MFAFNANAGGEEDLYLFKAANSSVLEIQFEPDSNCATFVVANNGDPWSAQFNPPTWIAPSRGKSEAFEISFSAMYVGDGTDDKPNTGNITFIQGRQFGGYTGNLASLCAQLGVEEVDAAWKLQGSVEQLYIEDFTGAPEDFAGGYLTRNVYFYPTDEWQEFSMRGTLGRHACDSVDLQFEVGRVAGFYSIKNFRFKVKDKVFAEYFVDESEQIIDKLGYKLNDDGTALVLRQYLSNTDTSFIIPNKVTYNNKEYTVTAINKNVFKWCTNLKSITIPNSITSIGDYTFYNCSSLTSVTISNSITSIGDYTFYNCSSLTSVTIPKSVTNIGKEAFYGCSSLNSVTIPTESVTAIGENAFYGCNNLTSITIPNSVTTIGENAFYGCKNLTIYCEAEAEPENWKQYDWNPYNRPVVWGYEIPNDNQGGENQGGENQSGETNNGNEEFVNVGYNNGYKTGYSNGYADGLIEAKGGIGNNTVIKGDEAFNEGYNDGYKEGIKAGNAQTAVSESAADKLLVYTHGRTIIIENATDEIRVYDAMGKLVCRDATNRVRAAITVNTTGVYIVKTGNVVKRVMVNL